MNRLRNIVGLIAICATAAFFTGCDEKDKVSTGPTSNAPDTLSGKSYTLSDAATGGTIAFDANNNYMLTQGGATNEAGTFTANRSGEVWDASLVSSAATTNSELILTFTAPGNGTYTFQRPGEPVVNGSFAEAAPGGGTTTTTGNTN